jgi:HlyD family secretion protein
MSRKRLILSAAAVLVAAGIAYAIFAPAKPLVLTGIVTTNDVIVSPQVGGQVQKLLVNEGDSVVAGQLLAVISAGELAADQAYYAHSAAGMATEVRETESAVRYQEQQMTQQVRQAEATVASAEAQRAQAAADLTNAQTNYDRYVALLKSGAISQQNVDQQRTELLVAKAKSEAADRQADAQRAALELARGQAEQVSMKRSALVGAQQQRAAAAAQTAKADVRLAYTEIHSPLNGVVDVRAVRAGEVIVAGSPIVTLINPDDLWIRTDVEESYIGRIKLGDHLKVRLPSGEVRDGTVFFRGVDAGFATQRDVSRSKRDIKTFEIRLRVDNKDRRLATGMTAYVMLPVS